MKINSIKELVVELREVIKTQEALPDSEERNKRLKILKDHLPSN